MHPGLFAGSFGSDEAALKRLFKDPNSGYSAGRGTLCSSKVDNISLPDCSSKFRITDACPDLVDWKSSLLYGEDEWDSRVALAREVPSYADPALRPSRPALTDLVVKMFRVGLVRPTVRRNPFGVEMFTCLKKEADPSIGQAEVQRLLFDMRRPNVMFPSPGGVVMGSGSALAALDLSDAAICGDQCWGSAGDLPNFFYTLELAEDFASYPRRHAAL